MNSQEINRREFLQTALTGIALGSGMMACQQESSAGLPRRPLGRTRERVSIIGLGGWNIGAIKEDKEAISIMHMAIDEGINFFDNCWDYHDGHSEEIMGKALASSNRRDRVILMSKVCARDYQGAMNQLHDSLRRLQTDRIDLWQFHGIKWDDDRELIFDPDKGALRAAEEARLEGKILHIGFTGHQDPRFHQAMLEKRFRWDSVQMPLNILDYHYRSFQKDVLPSVVNKRIGVIGMKALAAQNGIIPRELGISAELARRYVLSLSVSSLICGIESRENLMQDVRIARNFQPLSKQELEDLANRVKDHALDGSMEVYKTGNYGCDWHHRK